MMGLGQYSADLLVGDGFLRDALLAEKGQNSLARGVQQPHERQGEARQPGHGRCDFHGNRFGARSAICLGTSSPTMRER